MKIKKVYAYATGLFLLILFAIALSTIERRNQNASSLSQRQEKTTREKRSALCTENRLKIVPSDTPGELEWKRYYNEKYKFSYEYPGKITCASLDYPDSPVTIGLEDNLPLAVTSLNISNLYGRNLDAVVSKLLASTTMPKRTEEGRYNFAGVDAVEVSFERNEGNEKKIKYTNVLFVKENKLYSFTYQDQLGRQIFESWTFDE